MVSSRRLQERVQDRRAVFPVRRTGVRHEIRVLDLRFAKDRPDPGCYECWKEGLLGERWMDDSQMSRRASRDQISVLRRHVRWCYVQICATEKAAILFRVFAAPLRDHLVQYGTGVLSSPGYHGQDVPLYCGDALHGMVPASHNAEHPVERWSVPADSQIPSFHYDSGFILHSSHGIHPQHSAPLAVHPQNAAVGEDYVHRDFAEICRAAAAWSEAEERLSSHESDGARLDRGV